MNPEIDIGSEAQPVTLFGDVNAYKRDEIWYIRPPGFYRFGAVMDDEHSAALDTEWESRLIGKESKEANVGEDIA